MLRALVDEEWQHHEAQRAWSTDRLARLYDDCVRNAERQEIRDPEYLAAFGCADDVATAGDLWRDLLTRLAPRIPAAHADTLQQLLDEGSLATRILHSLGDDFGPDRVLTVYSELRDCLAANRLFTGTS